MVKTTCEWVQGVLDDTVKHIGHLDNASKEISNIAKKVEASSEGYEKERNNWEKVVMWLEDVQEFNL